MEHRFKPSKYYYMFGPYQPVLRLRAGDSIVTTTADAGGQDSTGNPIPPRMLQGSDDTEYYRANPLVGPFYVEGSEVGDTLIVEIEGIDLNRETAYSKILPNFGCLTEEGPGKRLLLNEPLAEVNYDWSLDLGKKTGTIELSGRRMEIPLEPFIGSIGVAPRYGRHETSLTPGEYGGNMDCVETKEGTTLYFPVFVRGGFLSFGDIHAAQGDGEICGVALETTAEVRLGIGLRKGKAIEWPRFEDSGHIMVAGSARPLMDAFKIAHLELTKWLAADYGFSIPDAFQILSQVGTCRVGNVVDTNYTVVAKFPKKYLKS
jgi:amidase